MHTTFPTCSANLNHYPLVQDFSAPWRIASTNVQLFLPRMDCDKHFPRRCSHTFPELLTPLCRMVVHEHGTDSLVDVTSPDLQGALECGINESVPGESVPA